MICFDIVPFSDSDIFRVLAGALPSDMLVHTFVNAYTNMVRHVVFSNIHNKITRLYVAIRSLLINYLIVEKIDTSSRTMSNINQLIVRAQT